jgi:hypothetical protein
MPYINHLMEKSKNNSKYNYSTKLKIGNTAAQNIGGGGFEMQNPKNTRSATTAVNQKSANNDLLASAMTEEVKVMEDNKVKLNERGEKTDNLLKKVQDMELASELYL